MKRKFEKGLSTQLIIRLLIPAIFLLSITGIPVARIANPTDVYAQTGSTPAINYPPSINTDIQKLHAIYSLIEQMRLEHNRQGALVKKDPELADKWPIYRQVFNKKLTPLLIEQSRLREEIRKPYIDQWIDLTHIERFDAEEAIRGDRAKLKSLPTEATTVLFDELKAINLSGLESTPFDDPVENFNSATWNNGVPQADPSSHISVDSNTRVTSTVGRNEHAYFYRDITVGTDDFEYLFEVYFNADTNGYAGCIAVADFAGSILAGGTTLVCQRYAGPLLRIVSWVNGSFQAYDSSITLSVTTLYYCTFERSSTTLTLYIYSDAARQNLVDTVSFTHASVATSCDRLYCVQSYNDGQAVYDDNYVQNFDVQGLTVPTVVTNAATLVEETTATLSGNITATGGENCTRGFEWDIDSGVPYSSNWTDSGTYGVGNFTHGLTGLTKGELYYYRATANNSAGWGYGDEVTFLTKPDPATSFTSTDNGTSWISLSWSNGTGMDYAEIRYSNSTYPTDNTSGSLGYWGSGTTANVTGLSDNTTYYFSLFTHATEGGLWSTADSYVSCQDTTDITINMPTVVTDAATLVEETTATLNGTITNIGSENCTRGFEWDIDSGAPYTDNWTDTGTHDIGAFNHGLTGLTPGDLYYFRATANNTAGYGYGSELTFLTKPLCSDNATSTGNTTTTISFEWTNTTGFDFAEGRISTSSYPTDNTSGTFAFWVTGNTTTIEGLDPNTKYYISIFTHATEGGLWATADCYETVTDTTDVGTPAVTNNGASGVTNDDAKLNGTITDDGGATCNVTWYWDTTDYGETESWANSVNQTGQSAGAISYTITDNLTPETLYYFIIKVVNAAGTDWSATANFTTEETPPEVETAATPIETIPIVGELDLNQLLAVLGLLLIAFWRGDDNEGIFYYCMAGASAIAMGLFLRGTYDTAFGVTLSIATMGVGFYCIMLAIWNVVAWIGRR